MRRAAVFAAASLAALGAAAPARAQVWRTVDATHQLRDTGAVSAHVEYAAGKLELKPHTGALLYHADVKYDANRSEPIARYDAASHALTIGVHVRNMRMTEMDSDNVVGSMHAELSTRVPMDLSLDLGAVEADLQLGGLRLTDLSLRTGAADITARFEQPNRGQLRSMTLQVGAAQVKMMDLVNSGVSRITAEVGAGALTLDFGGALAHDVDITATLAIGGLSLNLSPDVGVFVDESSLIGGFSKDGFVKRTDGWYSANYDAAPRHVKVHLHAFLGGLKLTREGR